MALLISKARFVVGALACIAAITGLATTASPVRAGETDYRLAYTPPFPFRHRYYMCYNPPRCRYPLVPVCVQWNKPGCCMMWQCGRMWMG